MHHLVADFLGYQRPPVDQAGADGGDDSDAEAGGITPILAGAGMGAIPASAELSQASNRAEAVTALERMFFGDLKDVDQL